MAEGKAEIISDDGDAEGLLNVDITLADDEAEVNKVLTNEMEGRDGDGAAVVPVDGGNVFQEDGLSVGVSDWFGVNSGVETEVEAGTSVGFEAVVGPFDFVVDKVEVDAGDREVWVVCGD